MSENRRNKTRFAPRRVCTVSVYASVNSSCAQLSPPGATAGHLQILRCQGAGHLPTPSFWHARGFLLEYNYTEDFTGKQADWFVCQGRETLKRFVKVCSRFYACISSLLIKPELYSETRKLSTWINAFLDIESSFSWYYLKNILSYLIYRFSQG